MCTKFLGDGLCCGTDCRMQISHAPPDIEYEQHLKSLNVWEFIATVISDSDGHILDNDCEAHGNPGGCP